MAKFVEDGASYIVDIGTNSIGTLVPSDWRGDESAGPPFRRHNSNALNSYSNPVYP